MWEEGINTKPQIYYNNKNASTPQASKREKKKYIFLRTSRKDYSLGIHAINTAITFSETMHIGVLSTFRIS